MTKKEIINEIKCLLSELDNGEDAVSYLTQNDVKWLNENIKALEQHSCYNPDEWCTTCSEYNQDKHCCPRYNKVIRNAVEEMKQETCEDAISRAEALKTINDMGIPEDMSVFEIKSHIGVEIGTLPPVQPKPKTGHWISYWDEEARCYVYKCPECGNKQPFDTKCCWECGTRLIVPQESENEE